MFECFVTSLIMCSHVIVIVLLCVPADQPDADPDLLQHRKLVSTVIFGVSFVCLFIVGVIVSVLCVRKGADFVTLALVDYFSLT